MTTYFAIVHKDADSAYGAYFPDLPGCYAAGDTEDEALANLRISLRMYAEDFVESGKTIPAPRRSHQLMKDDEVREALKDGGFLVMVPLLIADKKRRVNVTLEPSLIAAVDEAAKIAGTSRSEYLANAAWHEVKQSTGAVFVEKRRTAKDKPRASQKRKAARSPDLVPAD